MTRTQELQRLVDAYRSQKGRGTPAEYMAFMRARLELGEELSPAQRDFIKRSSKPQAGSGDADD